MEFVLSHHENPESPATPQQYVVQLGELPKPIDWTELFGRDALVEIEIGIGSGYFLSRYATEHPELNLFGLDKTGSEVVRTRDKCAARGATNVRLMRCDAIYFLNEYVAAESIQAFHVYYSDPWPKKRHHKRRLWRAEFLAEVCRTLAPGGRLYMKTDVTEYFEVIVGVIKAARCLRLVDERRLDHEPMEGDHVTNFQRKAIEQGHPLHYQMWEKI